MHQEMSHIMVWDRPGPGVSQEDKLSALTQVPEGTPELRLQLSGRSITVRPTLTKGKNLVWAVLRPGQDKMTGFGLPIPALAASLPTEAAIVNPVTGDKVSVQLTDGPTTFTDKETKVTKPAKPSKVYSAEHTVPGTTESRIFDIKVTDRGLDSQDKPLWNLKVTLRNPGGGGGASPVLDIFAEDDLVE